VTTTDTNDKKIQDYLDILNRRKWILVASLVLCIGFSLLINHFRPAYYISSTMILVEKQKIPQSYVMATDITPMARRLSTIKQQIMSRTKLDQIIAEFDLYKKEKTPGKYPRLARILRKFGGSYGGGFSNAEVTALMRSNIQVRVIGGRDGGDAFAISYKGSEPYTTMQVTNTLASLFIEENLKIREQYAEGTTEFLTSELEKSKEELEKQERAVMTFKSEHMGSLPEQLNANLRTLDRLQIELLSVGKEIEASEDRAMALEEQLGMSPGASTTDAGVVDPLDRELNRLKADLANLLSIYKEGYPDVIITKNRIMVLESQIEARRQSADASGDDEMPSEDYDYLKPTSADTRTYASLAAVAKKIGDLKERQTGLTAQITDYARRVEDSPTLEQRLIEIKRDYDISLQNYKSLLAKKLNAMLAKNMEERQKGERFRVIDPANLPEVPQKTKTRKILFMGIMAGGGFGLMIIAIMEFLNPTFRKPEDFFKVLDLPVLISIPDFDSERETGRTSKFKLIRGKKSASG
jgi:polysaccharide chain length determinant protein (PEP-CTERM system associated)